MGAGAKVWHPHALWFGLTATLLVIPVFWYRHVIEDRKKLNVDMQKWLLSGTKKAGMLPYVAIGAGLMLAIVGHYGLRYS